MLMRLIPKVFYAEIEDGLDLFVRCLDFKILHQDDKLVVVERDGAKAYLVQDAEFAAKDQPELTIETDGIQSLYDEISAATPSILHPNAKSVNGSRGGH